MTETSEVSLNSDTQVRGQRRQDAGHRLRQDDAEEHLEAAHAQGAPGVPLALCGSSGIPARKVSELKAETLQVEADDRGAPGGEPDVEEGRQDVERPVELQDQRRRAEELDECGGRRADRRQRRKPQRRPAAARRGSPAPWSTTVSTTVITAPCRSSGRLSMTTDQSKVTTSPGAPGAGRPRRRRARRGSTGRSRPAWPRCRSRTAGRCGRPGSATGASAPAPPRPRRWRCP